jgi:hypothetical protein
MTRTGQFSTVIAGMDLQGTWRLLKTTVLGNGTLAIRRDAQFVDVGACAIGADVQLVFDDITTNVFQAVRNTVNLPVAGARGLARCDAAMSGEHAGCDRRAHCTDLDSGGVTCTCVGSADVSVYGDGSICIQPPMVEVYAKARNVVLTLSKPKRLNYSFVVVGSGETNFNFSATVTGFGTVNSRPSAPSSWLTLYRDSAIAVPLPSHEALALSSAKSESTIQYILSIATDLLLISDGDRAVGLLSVALINLAGTSQTDSLSVELAVTAYASCQQSYWSMLNTTARPQDSTLHATILHDLLSFEVLIFAVDTDGLSINYSSISARVLWSDGSTVMALPANKVVPNLHVYRVLIPVASRSQAGSYLLSIELVDGWNETVSGNVDTCVLGTARIEVVCSTGFFQESETKVCRQHDTCKDSVVTLNGKETSLVKDGTDVVTIGGRLIVNMTTTIARMAESEAAQYFVRLVPLKLTRDFVAKPDGSVLVDLQEPGNFSLQVVVHTPSQTFSCLLTHLLEVRCDEGYASFSNGCQSVSSGASTVQMAMGIVLSALLVIGVVVAIAYAITHRQNMKGLIVHFFSTELMMIVSFLSEVWCAWPSALSHSPVSQPCPTALSRIPPIQIVWHYLGPWHIH